MMMNQMMPYTEDQGPNNSILDALPLWDDSAGETPDHRQYIFHYHTMMCPQFMNGYCPRHKASKSAPPQCFCFHFESQRRRPLVDTMTGQMRYWDVLCDRVAEGEECLAGDLCPFSHTREEISYHAAKYKTKLCNDRDCRGQEVCCFAHGEEELRNQALDRYSYWSIFGIAGAPAPNQAGQAMNGGLDLQGGYALGVPRGGGATGALYHPKVYKHRFCASYPNIAGCRRGEACAFAHNREEIRTSLLDEAEEAQRPQALTNDFFMYKFKTFWCPIGVQHDWQTCVYAHNYQDARRHPGIGYGPRPCPYWKRKETTLEYSQRCPLGVRCPFSHGAKEQLYHPSYFKTVTCQDWPNSNCPRGKLCAFWHRRSQQRTRASVEDDFNYKQPMVEARLSDALQADFLSPPFKLLNSMQDDMSGFPEFMHDMEQQQQQQQQPQQQHSPGGLDMSMGPMMPIAGGCTPQNYNWLPSDMPAALCNYGPGPAAPDTPTTTADSDEAATSDSSLSGDKSQSPQYFEEDRMRGGLGCGFLPAMPAMPLNPADMPWQQPGYDYNTQMWAGAGAPWACNASLPLVPTGMSGVAGQMDGPRGAMPGQQQQNHSQMMMQQQEYPGSPMMMQHQNHQQMMYYQQVQQPGMQPMAQQCPGGPSGAGGGPGTMLPLPASGLQMPQQMMMMELPWEASQAKALQDEGYMGHAPASEFFPAATSCNGGEGAMPTYNGFIHFKDPDTSDADMSPTGRPRANSH